MLRPWLHRFAVACALALGAVLAGCGGGGGSNTVAATPADPLAITGFAPTSAGVGDIVTVMGTGFVGVTGVRVGSVSATSTVDSATQLRVTVPAGATSGRIEVATAGRAVLSSSDLTIVAVPVVTGVTPNSIAPPARITVSGTSLDLVTQARLGNTALAIASQSATSLALDVPANASTGFLVLVAGDGIARQSAALVTVVGSMVVASFTPTSLLRGATLTITGSNLDRAASVEFGGGASSPVASRTGTTTITTVVPSAATSGPITVVGNAGDRVTSAASLTVVAPISVDAGATYRVSAGAPVTITGSGLLAVTGVTVGSSAGTITGQTDTQLVFSPPPGVNCGSITLLAVSQPSVPAGSLVVGSGCTLRAAGIEFAQVLSQVASDPYARLVPGKELLVRAYVVAETSGNVAPTVRLTGLAGGTVLGTLTMTGPATVPVLAAGAALPGSLRYDETQTYNASLPAAWIASGLSVRIDVDPEQRFGTTITATATPAVGTPTHIDLVLVPLVSGSNVPTMPDPALVLDELTRRMPAARGRISVSVRAPYTLTSATDGVDTEWSAVLSELEQLRRNEAPSRQYYGMVRPMVSAGTAGIGFVNRVGSSSPSLSALGWDASRTSWRRTMTHEFGHNYSRSHAPCGSVDNADPDYPYAGGALSSTPLFESLLDDIQSPANLSDVMGYCSGSWFSDYNWREVQRFLEARPQPALAVSQANAAPSTPAQGAAAGDVLYIAGRIDATGVRFEPIQRARGVATASAGGAYRLRVRTAGGGTFEVPFEAIEVDHAEPSEQQFFLTLPAPGAIEQLDVLQGDTSLPLRADGLVKARGAQATGGAAAAAIAWQQAGSRLAVTWDAGAAQFLSVTHVLNGARTVVGLHLVGGHADLDAGALPAGGELEFSLSSGLETRLIIVPR